MSVAAFVAGSFVVKSVATSVCRKQFFPRALRMEKAGQSATACSESLLMNHCESMISIEGRQ